MNAFKKWLFVVCLFLACCGMSGCALLSLPGQLIAGLFNLAGQGLSVASSMPTPPPWVFF